MEILQKLDRVLDLAIAFLEQRVDQTGIPAQHLGRVPTVVKPRLAKPPKGLAAPVPEPEQDPFKPIAPVERTPTVQEAAAAQPTIEDVQEAKLRCRELIVAFIQKRQRATPSGYEQAKELAIKSIGGMKKIEEMTYAEHVTLIGVFEKAEKSGA